MKAANRLSRLAPALVFCAALGALRPAVADELTASTTSTSAAAQREQLYAELAADVEELERRGNILKRVFKLVRPSIVHLEAKRDGEGVRNTRGETEEAGSGVIIERQGKLFVLTNRHVIKYSTLKGIDIRLADGRILHPTKIWSDPGTDISLLAVSGSDLLPAHVGDSNQLDIGDFVLAVGSPFGLSHSVTYGIISAKGRRDLKLGDDGVQFQDFLQTDAAINPGNSGGPLLNLRGEVIGINTAIASATGANEGIGFAIPINMVMLIADQLIERGSVTRAFLGVTLDAKYDAAAAARYGLVRSEGARVSSVTENSPADLARIRVGDIILEFDGTRVEDDVHLINLVSLTPVNKEVSVRLLRGGEMINLRLRVANRP